MLDLYGTPEQVAEAERRLERAVDGCAWADALTELAWYLRQRDPRRCTDILREARGYLGTIADPDRRDRMAARLQLAEAEGIAFSGQLLQAEQLLDRARMSFQRLDDRIGQGDCAMLDAWLAFDRGHSRGRADALAEAIRLYGEAGDDLRLRMAEALGAREDIHSGPGQALQRWGAKLEEGRALGHPGLSALADFFGGAVRFAMGEYAEAVRLWQRGADSAVLSGQVRVAVMMAVGAGVALDNLNDPGTALSSMEQGLNLARPTGWPAVLGLSLIQLSRPLRLLGQMVRARALLEEGETWLRAFPESRGYATACQYMGDITLDLGDFDASQRWYEETARLGQHLSMMDLLYEGLRGQAEVALRRGKTATALEVGNRALALVTEKCDRGRQMEALRVLAAIHRSHAKAPPPPGMLEANAVIHYLERALAVGESIAGMEPPADLFSELATAYAALGDFQRAYSLERRARSAQERTQARQVTERILALEVRHQTDRSRAEAEHSQRLAAAERAKAATAEAALHTLEQLGAIGQEITATLEAETVFLALARHVDEMLDAPCLAIFVMSEDGQALELRHGLEYGARLPASRIAMDDPMSLAARSARERREILSGTGFDEPSAIPGTALMQTVLFGPLMQQDRVLGVMSIQSDRTNAYGDRECQIFRTLCAYGAIALANADAYQRLSAARIGTGADTAPATAACGLTERERADARRALRTLTDDLALLRQAAARRTWSIPELDAFVDSAGQDLDTLRTILGCAD